MKKLMTMTRQFRDDENGAAMVEYTILLGIITVAVIATIILVGGWVSGQWTGLYALLPVAPTPTP
ncbi:Flp family type IVb pilin [Mesorhizobium sp. M00.F.Ca.ET.216.01.1.1]|uniref:Flp family type IVb pilin n=1 Tax=Mesorhizobium sp. M00.F.Ca.ET.216.01.1.1 TaxID=2500528 RepID=UPI000FD9D6E1|nr:Flp family type IVb pilin [Mesorhizobium sp. M00.F.Ca.ET.216.01.1.1]TGQ38339.1 Flp family type IVb pilin [Mesorhizobium sp. M00.F.Ca.ET.216.01.1.1]